MDNEKIARAYMAYWANYWVVSKKSTRYEYGAVLFMTMLLLLIQLLGVFICWMLQLSFLGQVYQWLILGFMIANLMPFITLSVRRLKDSGKTWWWLGLVFIPFANLF